MTKPDPAPRWIGIRPTPGTMPWERSCPSGAPEAPSLRVSIETTAGETCLMIGAKELGAAPGGVVTVRVDCGVAAGPAAAGASRRSQAERPPNKAMPEA